MPSQLTRYRAKRDFTRTGEPPGEAAPGAGGNLFMVHKHSATTLHYDLRLQIGDVLKSWAVPKGPSLDPKERRLAVEVEEHPLEYGSFEGVIPAGQYGAGPTLIWDSGTWAPMGDLERSLESGTLKFRLAGEKLKGGWTLARMKRRQGDRNNNWLLIKESDAAADADGDILEDRPESVVSGRTVEELLADDALRPEPKRKPARLRPGAVKGATRAPMPAALSPQLATQIDAPPDGAEWLHEIKLDGYRTLAFVAAGATRLVTRKGLDWTRRYCALADAFSELDCKQAVIDGEVVVLDEAGVSRFAALQEALAEGRDWRFVFFAFDLLYLNGWDLTGAALADRKALLERLLGPATGEGSGLQYSDHVVGNGSAFFDRIGELGLEGVISKRADARYQQRRSKSWVKAKAKRVGTFDIVGFTTSRAAEGLAALHVAERAPDGSLSYAGKVGTGFSRAEAADLEQRLREDLRDSPPLAIPGQVAKAHWVDPALKAVVQYSELTTDGAVRHGVFRGLVEPEAAAPQAAPPTRYISDKDLADIWVTNPGRRMFSRDGPTKLDLAVYYARIGDYLLPHILDRPVSFVRCPTGKAEDCFFQRHAFSGMPDAIGTFVARDDPDKNRDYLKIESAAGFLALAQYGAVELHPWGCRADKPDRPDRMFFDLDPGDDLEWRHVVEAALHVRDRLAELGLPSFVKTTGGKGLHVVVPLERRYSWKMLHRASGSIAAAIARAAPGTFTVSMAKRDRPGRVFIDFHRNAFSATSVGAYAARARKGLPVSTPLAWSQLSAIDAPADLNYFTVPTLVTKTGDPWADMAEQACRLPRHLSLSR